MAEQLIASLYIFRGSISEGQSKFTLANFVIDYTRALCMWELGAIRG